MRHIMCALLGHNRSASSAFRTVGGWHSRCKRCGTKLVRVAPKTWRKAESVKEAA